MLHYCHLDFWNYSNQYSQILSSAICSLRPAVRCFILLNYKHAVSVKPELPPASFFKYIHFLLLKLLNNIFDLIQNIGLLFMFFLIRKRPNSFFRENLYFLISFYCLFLVKSIILILQLIFSYFHILLNMFFHAIYCFPCIQM